MKKTNWNSQQRKIQGNSLFIIKKYKKISPISLKIPSPHETSKSLVATQNLKQIFSKFVNYACNF